MAMTSFWLTAAGVLTTLVGVFIGSASAADITVVSFEALAFKLTLVLIGGFLFLAGVVLGGLATLRGSLLEAAKPAAGS